MRSIVFLVLLASPALAPKAPAVVTTRPPPLTSSSPAASDPTLSSKRSVTESGVPSGSSTSK